MSNELHPFSSRHISLSEGEQAKLVAELGYESPAALLAEALPENIQIKTPLNVDGPLTETEALTKLRGLADQNEVFTSLIGMGWNDTITPAVIRRNMIENPAWYTAYTPYQPEISQGRLEMLTVFQMMISDLTGCELANASMLDEATAAAEAMTMLRRADRSKRVGFFVDEDCHPQTIAVVETRAEPLGIEVIVGDASTELDEGSPVLENIFGVLVAHPGSSGRLIDVAPIATACKAAKVGIAVTTDLLACTLMTPPGELGADVVVGSAQRFGVPMGYGGPHAGFMATSKKLARSLPGRLVGLSVDSSGKPAYRLALQTREQHIRREKATSNICTAQALLANVAASYACWHGPQGLIDIATSINCLASQFQTMLVGIGLEVTNEFFDTITVTTPGEAANIVAAAARNHINLRLVDNDHVGISFDERTTVETLKALAPAFEFVRDALDEPTLGSEPMTIPSKLRRTSEFLTDGRFNRYQSEHEMLRWLRKLADRDLALDRTMIPLGSCTMKLNAAAEMEPISWAEFANIHPYAPTDQVVGYRLLLADLEQSLVEITGYDAVSLQPNAGSQGEYAGLLAIRGYLKSIGEGHRNLCLIPSSAHGTNAASAVLAGMKVVVVASTERGDVDLDDLKAKVETHGNDLAALMVTYPSTHGVYEDTIVEICDLVHAAGGQVYTDGANMNAMVGVAKPGKFGSDVSHLNLHKTFCIPHGGGGPGVGPIGVGKHLAPFLPGHPVIPEAGPVGIGPVSAAPWGSASILPITWMYIQMMGPEGLKAATEAAVLAANYVAHRLQPYYPVLYSGPQGLVAHECILDIRGITEETGVSVDDIAKRLADCGFHAPTMSFPVPGTLMIEPTESESLQELDRFCDAMIVIKGEIDAVASGDVDIEDSVLRHAPHTAEVLLSDDWDRSYPRSVAAFPLPGMKVDKYFPPVGRVDNAWGDRNLNCSCPPLDAYS